MKYILSITVNLHKCAIITIKNISRYLLYDDNNYYQWVPSKCIMVLLKTEIKSISS